MSKVLIIGGGVGGLACGVALQAAGFEAHGYERAGELRPVGGGLGIWCNGMRALAALGLADQVRAAGRVIEAARLITWQGKTLAVTPVAVVGQQLGLVSIGVHRG